jgi:hypothetical protein
MTTHLTFINPNDPDGTKTKATIATWFRLKFSLEEHAVVNIHEIKCSDPGCVDVDTHFTFLIAGEQQHYIIKKPLVYIRKWDLNHMFKK